MPVCVGIFLIASPIVVLAWLKEEYDEDRHHLAVLTTCALVPQRCSLAVLTVWLVMTMFKNKW